MKFYNKEISAIYLIDFFTSNERQEFEITSSLADYFNKNGIKNISYQPNSSEELINALNEIYETQTDDPIIIHLIGHGDTNAVGFGNSKFYINWDEIQPLLIQINKKSKNSLIVNATIMCFGENIARINTEEERAFYIAIGSTTERTLQAKDQNILLYKKCISYPSFSTKNHLDRINDNLEISQGIRPYKLIL